MYKIEYTMLNGNKHVEWLCCERAKDTCVEDIASDIYYALALDKGMKSIGVGKLIRRDHVSTVHNVEIVRG